MSVLEIIGYVASILIGLSLGLIGGGGSILTVPVLVYLMGVSPVLATAYSLFVVGTTSLVGSVSFMRKGLVHYRTALVFAFPSFIAVFITRKWVVPAIPDPVFTMAGMPVTKNIAIMVFFAMVMVAAAISMIRTRHILQTTHQPLKYNYPIIALEGALVGAVTGLVGAGGGFLIIPALVLLARLPMKMAVGTSLLIIAAKSLIGFIGDISSQPINWSFMLIFTALSVSGIFVGSWLSSKIHASHLKRGFGWFVLLMGIYIIFKEMFL